MENSAVLPFSATSSLLWGFLFVLALINFVHNVPLSWRVQLISCNRVQEPESVFLFLWSLGLLCGFSLVAVAAVDLREVQTAVKRWAEATHGFYLLQQARVRPTSRLRAFTLTQTQPKSQQLVFGSLFLLLPLLLLLLPGDLDLAALHWAHLALVVSSSLPPNRPLVVVFHHLFGHDLSPQDAGGPGLVLGLGGLGVALRVWDGATPAGQFRRRVWLRCRWGWGCNFMGQQGGIGQPVVSWRSTRRHEEVGIGTGLKGEEGRRIRLGAVGIIGRRWSWAAGHCREGCEVFGPLQAALVGLPAWGRRKVFSMDGAVILAHVPSAVIGATIKAAVVCSCGVAAGWRLWLEKVKEGNKSRNYKKENTPALLRICKLCFIPVIMFC